MRVIGIDLGTICCGYGIVELRTKNGEVGTKKLPLSSQLPVYIASGVIRMNSKTPLPERLKHLYTSLKKIINEYKPSQLCIEKIFYHKSISSAFALGSTRGIAMLLAAEDNMPVFEYNSTELKMALTGYGRAEKRQVKEMVIRILNLNLSSQKIETLSEDMTDALALCVCHINNQTGYR
ncbi:MAG: crossover junction endodeoxyribonuclease RuvC [Nitrospirae bacterium]|nr:crossover junction endodeoxyribonuclease RuvC [Nitrospirota bacterium]